MTPCKYTLRFKSGNRGQLDEVITIKANNIIAAGRKWSQLVGKQKDCTVFCTFRNTRNTDGDNGLSCQTVPSMRPMRCNRELTRAWQESAQSVRIYSTRQRMAHVCKRRTARYRIVAETWPSFSVRYAIRFSSSDALQSMPDGIYQRARVPRNRMPKCREDLHS